MTHYLLPQYFFDLSTYAHETIFDDSLHTWEAVGRIEAYLRAAHLGLIEVDVPSGVFLVNPELIRIEKNTKIEPGSYIQGPCWIGQNCTIRHGAYIRGNVIAGNRCVIGHATELKNTILLDGAKAAHFNYLGDSILGNGVNLGAGTICANLRLDHKPVQIKFEKKLLETHLPKLGAILGDETNLGCNTVTNPGTFTGQRVFSYPGANFGGFHPAGSIIRNSH